MYVCINCSVALSYQPNPSQVITPSPNVINPALTECHMLIRSPQRNNTNIQAYNGGAAVLCCAAAGRILCQTIGCVPVWAISGGPVRRAKRRFSRALNK